MEGSHTTAGSGASPAAMGGRATAFGGVAPTALMRYLRDMNYCVYVLQSELFEKYYVGSTNNIDERVKRHNQGRNKSTARYKPWVLVYKEIYQTRNDAYKRELQIKSYKGGEAFKKLLVVKS